jgi:adenine C2-methylase RlmN of 23S rRNA A2503 and tRNA A37
VGCTLTCSFCHTGTQTRDTFSLLGATAMIEDAEKRCAG